MHLKLTGIALIIASAIVNADVLELTDGAKIHGTVTKIKEDGRTVGYEVTTPDGSKKVYDKDDVRKFTFECSKPISSVIEDVAYLESLLEEALTTDQPEQREYVGYWGSAWNDYWSERGGRREREAVSSDRFVDEWAKYSAVFGALDRDPRVKKMLKAKKRSNTLKEFALYPPESHSEFGVIVKDLLDAVKKCRKLATRTSKSVRATPGHLPTKIASVRNKIAHADSLEQKARRGGTTQAHSAMLHRKAAMAREAADKAQIRMREDFRNQVLAIDRMINDLATERRILQRQFEAVKDYLTTENTE